MAKAQEFTAEITSRGGTVLFVGTKKQARDAVRDAATNAGMPYVNQRWLGGLLTNFQTLNKRIRRLHQLTEWTEDGTLELLPTRERIAAIKEREKLEINLGGVRNMQRTPDAVFVVDLKTEAIAVAEARRLRIPIIGLVDTNVDPDPVTYPIPGNDDAIRSCKVIVDAIGDVAAERARPVPCRGGSRTPRARGAGAARGRGARQARGGGACAARGRGAAARGRGRSQAAAAAQAAQAAEGAPATPPQQPPAPQQAEPQAPAEPPAATPEPAPAQPEPAAEQPQAPAEQPEAAPAQPEAAAEQPDAAPEQAEPAAEPPEPAAEEAAAAEEVSQ